MVTLTHEEGAQAYPHTYLCGNDDVLWGSGPWLLVHDRPCVRVSLRENCRVEVTPPSHGIPRLEQKLLVMSSPQQLSPIGSMHVGIMLGVLGIGSVEQGAPFAANARLEEESCHWGPPVAGQFASTLVTGHTKPTRARTRTY